MRSRQNLGSEGAHYGQFFPPILAFLWLGLNVIRFYSYDGEQGIGPYMTVVRFQDAVLTSGLALAVVAALWWTFEFARWLIHRAFLTKQNHDTLLN